MILVVAATEPELRAVEDDEDVTTLVCGVGPVDAALMTARQLATTEPPAALLHVGIAGCRRGSGHAVLDTVIGTGARYCDTSSTFVEQLASPDSALLDVVRAALPEAAAIPIATSADVGGSHGCDIEAMEGFAVLRVAEVMHVPAVELRVIANEIEEADRAKWDFAGALAKLHLDVQVAVDAIRSAHDGRS